MTIFELKIGEVHRPRSIVVELPSMEAELLVLSAIDEYLPSKEHGILRALHHSQLA
jgi:hypothetical protein